MGGAESSTPAGGVLLPGRGGPLIGFDFDCTLTSTHFYKAFAWGYSQGQRNGFADKLMGWCKARGLPEGVSIDAHSGYHQDPMTDALEFFCTNAGDKQFREMFRDLFLGGEERIQLITTWLAKSQLDHGCEYAIVTAGQSSAVLRALNTAVPEWTPFFPNANVWDTSQSRHAATSVAGAKCLMLRDLRPDARWILLVDDALKKDVVPGWITTCTKVESWDKLVYEGPGISAHDLEQITQLLRANCSDEKQA